MPCFFHFYIYVITVSPQLPFPEMCRSQFWVRIYIYIYFKVICFLAHPMMSSTRRNLSCIGCGSSRPTSTLSQNSTTSSANTRPTLSSPRFTQNNPTTFYSSGPTPPHSHLTSYHNPIGYPSQSPTSASASPPSHVLSLPNKSAHPLLTPSGRVFAVGGKVQNISSDPLNPCIMYWPDNEPFPEQGQIRPSGLAGIPVSFF